MKITSHDSSNLELITIWGSTDLVKILHQELAQLIDFAGLKIAKTELCRRTVSSALPWLLI
jgi:hypothetical protein